MYVVFFGAINVNFYSENFSSSLIFEVSCGDPQGTLYCLDLNTRRHPISLACSSQPRGKSNGTGTFNLPSI